MHGVWLSPARPAACPAAHPPRHHRCRKCNPMMAVRVQGTAGATMATTHEHTHTHTQHHITPYHAPARFLTWEKHASARSCMTRDVRATALASLVSPICAALRNARTLALAPALVGLPPPGSPSVAVDATELRPLRRPSRPEACDPGRRGEVYTAPWLAGVRSMSLGVNRRWLGVGTPRGVEAADSAWARPISPTRCCVKPARDRPPKHTHSRSQGLVVVACVQQ